MMKKNYLASPYLKSVYCTVFWRTMYCFSPVTESVFTKTNKHSVCDREMQIFDYDVTLNASPPWED